MPYATAQFIHGKHYLRIEGSKELIETPEAAYWEAVVNTAHSSALASLRFTGTPWKTADGVYIARPDDIVYVYEATDGYSRWSGKIIPIKFSTWLDKSDPDWQGHPSTHLKRQCPDGAWNCYSTPEAAEGARLITAIAPFAKGNK